MATDDRPRPLRALVAIGVFGVLVSPLTAVAGIALMAGGGSDERPTVDPSAAGAAGVPTRAGIAYQRAAGRCPGLDWSLLAAVGAVESRHGQVDGSAPAPDTGEVRPWIFGPPLDGSRRTAAIPAGQRVGWWGLTGPWTQAVGPMQFLPSTFDRYAVDADRDGVANPHDIDDATATAAEYVCVASDGSVDGPSDVARIYNPGDASYADRLAAERKRIRDAVASSTDRARRPTSATTCPVAGRVEFTDTFGAARSGGREHEGVDIFAPTGTPVVAPADGTVEHYDNSLGGLSYRLYADDGTYYYGTHLSNYENVGAGRVTAGTIIGYVGQTGNAATTPPHLHWEIHPGGRGSPAVNPTATADASCS